MDKAPKTAQNLYSEEHTREGPAAARTLGEPLTLTVATVVLRLTLFGKESLLVVLCKPTGAKYTHMCAHTHSLEEGFFR